MIFPSVTSLTIEQNWTVSLMNDKLLYFYFSCYNLAYGTVFSVPYIIVLAEMPVHGISFVAVKTVTYVGMYP